MLGFGTDPDVGVVSLLPEEDKSPYSARSFIKPDKTTLHVEPGETKSANVTVTIPSDVGSGGRYAILRFSTVPPKEGMVNIVSAIVLPVTFTIKGSQLTHEGKITEVSAGKAVSGNPVNISTTFQNTGNHHFKFKEVVIVSNARGEILDTIYTALSPSSVIPSLSGELRATFVPKGELPLGVYSVKCRVMLEDGTVLDEASGSFEVKEPYVPPPAAANITLTPGSSANLGTTDGRISIAFLKNSVTSEVEVSIQSYPSSQLPTPQSGITLGTTSFRVDGIAGLLLKNASIKVKYNSSDLDKLGGDASKLELSRWDEAQSKWMVLKTKVDTGVMTLTADTNQFGIFAVVAGGAAGPVTSQASTRQPAKLGPVWIGIFIVGGLIIGFSLSRVITRKKAQH